MIATVEGFYNPAVYGDAGLPEPSVVRDALLDNPFAKHEIGRS